MKRVRVELPPLHDKQRVVAESDARFKVLVSGRRFGKTALALWLALDRALNGQVVWWVAPVHGITLIAWRQCKRMMHGVPIITFRESTRTMHVKNGGLLAFKSGEDPNNLRGEGLDYCVLDEADFMDEEVWVSALRPALSDRKGGALFCSTPNRENGWFHNLFKRGSGEDTEIQSWQFASWDNPHLDRAEIEKARDDMPSIAFRREYGAEFVSASGGRVRKEWLQKGEPPARSLLRVTMGVDLAISQKRTADYTAIAVLGREASGPLWVLDVARDRTGFRGALDMIQTFAEIWSPEAIGVEQVAYQQAAVEELLRTTALPVRAVVPKGDKVSRFAGLEARYERRMVRHNESLRPEFEAELLSFPVGKHDDMVDALSTAWALQSQGYVYHNAYVPRDRRRPARRYRI